MTSTGEMCKKVDAFYLLLYTVISDRVTDTREDCNLKRAPAGALLLRIYMEQEKKLQLISPYESQEIASSMCYCRSKAL